MTVLVCPVYSGSRHLPFWLPRLSAAAAPSLWYRSNPVHPTRGRLQAHMCAALLREKQAPKPGLCCWHINARGFWPQKASSLSSAVFQTTCTFHPGRLDAHTCSRSAHEEVPRPSRQTTVQPIQRTQCDVFIAFNMQHLAHGLCRIHFVHSCIY
jgi:hypothetical protein